MKYKKWILIYSVAIFFYFFIETFYNLMVDINAYVFMNLSDIILLLPTLILVLFFLLCELLFFSLKKIKHNFKFISSVLFIGGFRLSTLFISIPNLVLIVNFLLLFSIMFFFNEVIYIIERNAKCSKNAVLLFGIIIGICIQFFFLIVNVSSNLSSDSSKWIPNISFIITIIGLNLRYFNPKELNSIVVLERREEKNLKEMRNLSYFHFIIFGIIFTLALIWILNPMAISSYDIFNLNYLTPVYIIYWPSYGFTYYIFIILVSLVVSYFIVNKYFLGKDLVLLKRILGLLGILFILLNILSLFIIENDLTIISTIYLTFLTITNVSFLCFYCFYLFTFYSLLSRRKLYLGSLLFFLTILFFILLQVQILWYEYISLLINVIILTSSLGIVVLLVELVNYRNSIKIKPDIIEFNKIYGILLIISLIFNSIGIFTISYQRELIYYTEENPRFMIWNIHNGIGIDDRFNLERIVDEIKAQDADIIGLNEVDMGALKTSFIDIPSFFAHKLNMYYYYGYTFYKHYGNVLLSKYPIQTAEIIKLPLNVSSAEPRSMIKATLNINSSIWTIYVTHLSTEKYDRTAQVPFIVNKINEQASFERTVWMGDFNLEPTSTEYLLINGTNPLNFIDTYPYLNSDSGYTGDFDESNQPTKRIDYIMCSLDLLPTSSEIFCSVSSDHCALITNF